MMVKTERFIELAVLLAIFIVVTLSFPMMSAFIGNSPNLNSSNKYDAVTGTEDSVISTSFTQRFIGGNQPVANTTSASFYGRFGILFEVANATVGLISPANNSAFVNDGVNNITFSYIYGGGTANNCSLVIDNIINQTIVSPTASTMLNFNQNFNVSSHNWTVFCHIGSLISGENRTFSIVSGPNLTESGCDSEWVCSSWSECSSITSTQTRTCTDISGNNCPNKPSESQLCVPCQENWQCGSFGSCLNGEQTRTCFDIGTNGSACGTTFDQPNLNQSCISQLTIDYTPSNLNLIVPNGSTIDFEVDASHTDSGVEIDADWDLNGNGIQSDSGIGSVISGVSLDFNDIGNFEVESSVSTIDESVDILWNVDVIETACVENWTCSVWSFCENDAEFSMPSECVDLNGCGTNFFYPEKRRCTCQISWNCGEWSECRIDYEINDLIDNVQTVKGRQTRECFDSRNCAETNKTEYYACDVNVSIDARVTEWCEEEFVELYVKENNQLVSRVKKMEVENLSRFDISFITTEFSGYCGYCENGIKDEDEEGVDCGGPNCDSCHDRKFFDWLFWLILLLWILLCILIIDYLSNRKYRHEIEIEAGSRLIGFKRLIRRYTLTDWKEKRIEKNILKKIKS
jgi:hypothetical protein